MAEVIGYIVSNYTWFLVGAIIILLAIIGSYADKTNFGQGKNRNSDSENDIVNENSETIFQEPIRTENSFASNDTNNMEINSENDLNTALNTSNNFINDNLDTTSLFEEDLQEISNPEVNNIIQPNQTNVIDEIINEELEKDVEKPFKEKEIVQNNLIDQNFSYSLDEGFDKFDEEFNNIIPKKEIIDGELLDDIDELTLDKKYDFSSNSIPDLDDVDLPKIKGIEKEDNIWKF